MIEKSILEQINLPNDLQKFNLKELNKLCEEIRELIIEVITKNGGHLASSLGVVELIVALHYVFDTPKDKIIFDVGHQSYAHKIITGRKDTFKNIRKKGGPSGFPKRSESVYDTFNTGHSSTSISAALGMATANQINNTSEKTIAVIGDGALTGGMALEALNHASNLKNNFIVILNDNQMSISQNVGALSSYLSIHFTNQKHIEKREKVKKILKKIMPKKNKKVIRFIQKIEDGFKRFFVSSSGFFEALGFKYVGPINGHNLMQLIKTLENIKNINRPILLHISTIKGKGYSPAEDDPSNFHGVSESSCSLEVIKTTEKQSIQEKSKKTYTNIFGNRIIKLAETDSKIVAITAAMSQGTGLDNFFTCFPKRSFDVGIAEQHAITYAAGMAANGLKPIVAIYSTFLQRGFDQLYHDVALQNLPIILAIDRAGFVGEDGETHHGILDLSYLNLLPNFTIMAPQDEHELEDMLEFAINLNAPVAIRYPRGNIIGENKISPNIILAKAYKLKEGNDIAIFAIGSTVWPSLKASNKLQKENIKAAVINLRFLKPFDETIVLNEIKNTKKILTVEENIFNNGIGSTINNLLIQNNINDVEVINLAINQEAIEHDRQENQRKLFYLDENGIYKKSLELLNKK